MTFANMGGVNKFLFSLYIPFIDCFNELYNNFFFKSFSIQGSSQESRDSLMSDSNSDSEDFYHVLKASKQALRFVGSTIQQTSQKMNTFSSEFVSK